jgi:hypothetical protein
METATIVRFASRTRDEWGAVDVGSGYPTAAVPGINERAVHWLPSAGHSAVSRALDAWEAATAEFTGEG